MADSPVVIEARRWIGTPYRHQQSVLGVGCDCLGLLRGIWRALHGPEPEAPPPYTRDFAERTGEETLMAACDRYLWRIGAADAAPGDVVLYRMRAGAVAKHCAIISAVPLDAGAIIHAYAGRHVCETPPLRAPVAGFWRFPEALG